MREKHGNTTIRLYRIWQAMRQRCGKPYSKAYPAYGARGIRVCDEWQQSFPAFYAWAMANGYADHLSIDRYPDMKGNYEPGNCRWATKKEQAENRTNSRMVELDGVTKTLSEWSRIKKVNLTNLYNRYQLGLRGAELFDPSIKFPCPHCGRAYKTLGYHLKRAHPEAAQAARMEK